MHLVILSSPRAGAHMLRSMLVDPLFDDLGAFLSVSEDRVIPIPAAADHPTVKLVYETELAARPGRLLVSHLKLGLDGEAIQAAADTGGCFLMLTRRDRLAQACSLLYGLQHNALRRAGPKGATISPEPQRVRGLIAHFERLEKLAGYHLEGQPFVGLAYEDIAVETVSAAVSELTGRKLTIGEPTTQKSAPRLADFVTNLSELI